MNTYLVTHTSPTTSKVFEVDASSETTASHLVSLMIETNFLTVGEGIKDCLFLCEFPTPKKRYDTAFYVQLA